MIRMGSGRAANSRHLCLGLALPRSQKPNQKNQRRRNRGNGHSDPVVIETKGNEIVTNHEVADPAAHAQVLVLVVVEIEIETAVKTKKWWLVPRAIRLRKIEAIVRTAKIEHDVDDVVDVAAATASEVRVAVENAEIAKK